MKKLLLAIALTFAALVPLHAEAGRRHYGGDWCPPRDYGGYGYQHPYYPRFRSYGYGYSQRYYCLGDPWRKRGQDLILRLPNGTEIVIEGRR